MHFGVNPQKYQTLVPATIVPKSSLNRQKKFNYAIIIIVTNGNGTWSTNSNAL